MAASQEHALPESQPSTGLSFEEALQELESLVERLESGEQNLEQALRDFERGIALTRQCETQLREAEQVVHKLVSEQGGEHLTPFTDENPIPDE